MTPEEAVNALHISTPGLKYRFLLPFFPRGAVYINNVDAREGKTHEILAAYLAGLLGLNNSDIPGGYVLNLGKVRGLTYAMPSFEHVPATGIQFTTALKQGVEIFHY